MLNPGTRKWHKAIPGSWPEKLEFMARVVSETPGNLQGASTFPEAAASAGTHMRARTAGSFHALTSQVAAFGSTLLLT